jgi:hypothetical protein
MEIKINKEIRGYQESIFFGLSMRQFACSIVAVGAAVGLYFGLRAPLGNETVSWVCILGAAPVAAAGFFHFNGLNLEQFLWAVFKSEWLCAGVRLFKAENIYRLATAMKGVRDHD